MPNPTAHPEAQEAPEERTLREIAELPVPVPGETWYHCDGEPVEILDVRHDGHDHIMAYRWMQDGRVETRTLRSWYGFERPGVRRFQRERPGRPDVERDPYPWEGRTKITVATPNPDGWSHSGPVPLPSVEPTTPPDYQADVRAFHEALVPDQVADRPTMPPGKIINLRLDLIEEEFGELWAALHRGDLVAVADALADLLYVTYGTAVACGIDVAPIWREVHRSNMAKEGGPTRADGKILKPEGWTPPDVRGELIRQGWRDPADAATTVQPTPRGTGREITPLVVADLEARSRIGAEKYGEPLRAHNGRDALVDLYEELLDAVQYARQAIEERGGMPQTGGDDE